jgi:Domain of unknown function (DUF4872)/Butirosin biosynthesis protein H, N-terminal
MVSSIARPGENSAILPGYSQFGGKHGDTGTLRNILAQMGLTAPHTGRPYTEEMLLGLGGGIGAGYWVFEFGHSPDMVLGLRHSWENNVEFLRKICGRIGAGASFKETGGAKAAEANLRQPPDQGRPAVVWVDLSSMPYFSLFSGLSAHYIHVVGVCGIDDERGRVYIDDRAAAPLTVTMQELEAARARVASYKHRVMIVDAPTDAPDLRAAIQEGIRDCCQGLLSSRISNFSLKALSKWAGLVANPRDKKGWPNVFPPGRYLYKALMGVLHAVELNGTGGGAFRSMYAGFLDEASGVLSDPRTREVSDRYRAIAAQWRELAEAALPGSVKPLREARELALRKNALFDARGAGAAPEIEEINRTLESIQ